MCPFGQAKAGIQIRSGNCWRMVQIARANSSLGRCPRSLRNPKAKCCQRGRSSKPCKPRSKSQSTIKNRYGLKRKRSANAPVIKAGVITANIPHEGDSKHSTVESKPLHHAVFKSVLLCIFPQTKAKKKTLTETTEALLKERHLGMP